MLGASTRRLALGFSLGVGTICFASTARADSAAADQLFQEAKTLLSDGRVHEACPKFEASLTADNSPALGVLMNLADCLERDGRLASSFGRWSEAVELAQRRGDDRVEFAKERREALRPKLSFITVQVTGNAADLAVWEGNTKLTAGAYGTALPANPGETAVQVVRGDSVVWERKVTLKEGQRADVPIDLAAIAIANPAPVKKRTDAIEISGGAGEATVSFWSDQRIAGLVVALVGVAGAGGGFALGGVASSKTSEIDAHCTTAASGQARFCTPTGAEAVSDAAALADGSTWTLIASGIVAAVGVTVFVTAPGEAAELEERAWVGPWVGPSGGGLVVGGRF